MNIYMIILIILYIALTIFVFYNSSKIGKINYSMKHTEDYLNYLINKNSFQAEEMVDLRKKIKELDEKVNSKTNANIFYETFGYDVPKDMYNRYSGYWESKFVKRK